MDKKKEQVKFSEENSSSTANPNRVAEYYKQYYAKNKEKIQQYYKEHYTKNFDKNKQQRHDYYINNKETIINNNLKYYYEFKDDIRTIQNDYYKEYYIKNRSRLLQGLTVKEYKHKLEAKTVSIKKDKILVEL